jgi:hypothetical protein
MGIEAAAGIAALFPPKITLNPRFSVRENGL